MKGRLRALVASLFFVLYVSPALAGDMEGTVESINQEEPSFAVQGITFFVTQSTDYDDGLNRLDDLREGQRVEVDFEYRDGKHFVTEVELED